MYSSVTESDASIKLRQSEVHCGRAGFPEWGCAARVDGVAFAAASVAAEGKVLLVVVVLLAVDGVSAARRVA